jgi:predicted DNA-binding transcriptional regulator YafY
MARKPRSEHTEQSERHKWFHREVAAGNYPTATKLAEHFAISVSTAHKDIEALKKEHGAPLVYDRAHHGFRYSNPLFALEDDEPAPQGRPGLSRARTEPVEGGLTQGELVAILVADVLQRQYRTAPFYEAVRNAFDKVAASLGESASYDQNSLERILELELEPFPTLDLGIFDALLKAISWRETVVLKYFSGQKATVTNKPCDPLHVINYKDNWYLVAFCHEKQDYRDFLLNRVLSVEFTGTNFPPYKDFHIEKHKRESQLFRGMESPVEVVMEFDKFAAHWIRLRPVHRTQKIVERADGSLEISFRVYSYENLLRWVLSFGEHARVLAPLDLQARVHKTISRMSYLYNRF